VRIASLLPSATEMVCALGLEEELVAVTHECDHPPAARGKPVVTASVLEAGLDSAEIDRHIRALVHAGSSVYRLDADRLAALRPDLILTQELCEVCAVSYPVVERAARRLPGSTQLISLEPERLEDVFEHLALLGRVTGREGQAERVVHGLRLRLDRLERRLAGRPRVSTVCLEWLDPLFNCGHWTPQLVSLAGGDDLLGVAAKPAHRIVWDEVLRADPQALVVMACGFSLQRSLELLPALTARPGFGELRAARDGRVFVVDGNAYFSRPGPRLVDSAEILAGLLHPEAVEPPPLTAAAAAGKPPPGSPPSARDSS
jgi:iron complex transport system substrate-binding protein